jgi:hypothetical protein
MRLLVRFLIPLASVALLAACGSSGGSPAASSSAPSASTSASASGNADTAAVTQVWQSFFSKETPIGQKELLVQNGTGTMKPAIQAFASDPRVGQASATVQKVDFPSATEADVTYQISLNGAVVMGGMAGKAVKSGGNWLVSATTLCGLLQLAQAEGGGSSGSAGAIPGCS